MKMVVFADVNGAEYVFPEDSIQSMQTKMTENGIPTTTFIVKVNDGKEALIEVDQATFNNLSEFYTKEYNEYWTYQTEKLAAALAEDDDDDDEDSLKDKLDELLRQQAQAQQPYNQQWYSSSSGATSAKGPNPYTLTGGSSASSLSASSAAMSNSTIATRARQSGKTNTTQAFLKSYLSNFTQAKKEAK
jgi:hypothetical protein